MKLKRKVPEELIFKTFIEWDGERGGKALTGKSQSEIFFDTPKIFGGKGRYACPDELFLASLGGCLMNTFLYLAKNYVRYIKDFKIATECEIKLESDAYIVSNIRMNAKLIALEKYAQAIKTFLEAAYEHCHLIQLVRKSTNLELTVEIGKIKKNSF